MIARTAPAPLAPTCPPAPPRTRFLPRRSGSILTFAALTLAAALLAPAVPSRASPVLAPPAPPGPAVQPLVRMPAGRIALTHVRVIDGTGAPAQADRTVLIDRDRIAAVQPAAAPVPAGYTALDLSGDTVLPVWSACTTTSTTSPGPTSTRKGTARRRWWCRR